MTNKVVWLNSACLGSCNTQGSDIDTTAVTRHLQHAFGSCIEWVANWCGSQREQVLLTSGTTDACEVALITRNGLPDMLLHSDLAHESTMQTVSSAAEFLGQLGQKTITTAQVKISDLFDREPSEFAGELGRRLKDLCGSGATVLVLEHVTSEDGYLLPLHHILSHLQDALPALTLVVDGAQASGLWRPPANLNYAYAGCFHKYINAPVATGFCVLPDGLASRSLHRLRATRYKKDVPRGEYLPTIDAAKWIDCAIAIQSLQRRASLEGRVERIRELRRILCTKLFASLKEHIPSARDEYRSHILSLRLDTPEKSREAWSRLLNSGFATKQLANGIRITLHDTLDVQSVSTLAEALNEALREA